MAATRATVIYKASFNADHVSIFALSMDTNQLFFLALLQLALYIYHVNTSTIKYYREVNATVNCNDLGQMDRAALAMTSYGDRSNSQPLTPEQVYEELCPKLNKSSRIIKAYAKTCFKPFPRQIIGLLVKGNLRELRKLCSSEEERYLFSKHSQCLQDFDPENVHKCMDNYIIDVESIRDNVHDLDLKLPYSCCIFWDFKQVITFFSIHLFPRTSQNFPAFTAVIIY